MQSDHYGMVNPHGHCLHEHWFAEVLVRLSEPGTVFSIAGAVHGCDPELIGLPRAAMGCPSHP